MRAFRVLLLLLPLLTTNGCVLAMILGTPHPVAECYGASRTGYAGRTMDAALRRCKRAKDEPCTPIY